MLSQLIINLFYCVFSLGQKKTKKNACDMPSGTLKLGKKCDVTQIGCGTAGIHGE